MQITAQFIPDANITKQRLSIYIGKICSYFLIICLIVERLESRDALVCQHWGACQSLWALPFGFYRALCHLVILTTFTPAYKEAPVPWITAGKQPCPSAPQWSLQKLANASPLIYFPVAPLSPAVAVRDPGDDTLHQATPGHHGLLWRETDGRTGLPTFCDSSLEKIIGLISDQ